MSKEEETKYHIKILSREVKPYWYSLGQLKLKKMVEEYKLGRTVGHDRYNPIVIGLQEPQYGRIYEQIQALKGVYPANVGSIIEFDDLFYNTYIRVKLISRELKYGS